MKIGRNQPCPCGSGKKYKKCCLAKDEAAARSLAPQRDAAGAIDDGEMPEPSARRPGPKKDEKNPERERWSRFWEEFGEASLDKRLGMTRALVEETADFDGDLGSELIEGVAAACQEGGRIGELEEIISQIEQRHPRAFQEEAHWFHGWRVENALLTSGDVRTPLLAFAAHADRGIDELFRLGDRLLYHGREVELLEAFSAAWPLVRDCGDIMDHGKVELQDTALSLILHRHLARKPDLSPDDPELLTEIEPYRASHGHPWWKDVIELRTGRHEPVWDRAQFVPIADLVEYGLSVFQLSEQLAMVLQEQHGWPWCRAELAQEETFKFFLVRGRKKAGSRKEKKTPRASASPFSSLLTPESADEFMAGRLDFLGPRPYRAVVFAQALPHLLSLLIAEGLLDAGEARHLEDGLRKRCEPLGRMLDRFVYDPVLLQELRVGSAQRAELTAARG